MDEQLFKRSDNSSATISFQFRTLDGFFCPSLSSKVYFSAGRISPNRGLATCDQPELAFLLFWYEYFAWAWWIQLIDEQQNFNFELSDWLSAGRISPNRGLATYGQPELAILLYQILACTSNATFWLIAAACSWQARKKKCVWIQIKTEKSFGKVVFPDVKKGQREKKCELCHFRVISLSVPSHIWRKGFRGMSTSDTLFPFLQIESWH